MDTTDAMDAMDTDSPTSTIEVEARSYEMDSYGHMNQAVAVQWFEHGRLVYFHERGMSYLSVPADYDVHVMVLRQDVTYRAQVRICDRFAMTSKIIRFGRTSFTWEHRLVPVGGSDSAIEATVTMVCVAPDGTSTPMPEALRNRLAK